MSGTAEQPNGGVAQVWSEPQHAIAYQEIRAILTAQQKRKTNLDNMAIRTAKLATVIVGALITVVKVFGVRVTEPAGIVGIVLLVVSFGTALLTYCIPGLILGPGAVAIENLVQADEQWEKAFLSKMEEAVDVNADRIGYSSLCLIVSDLSIFLGVVAILYALAL